MIKSLDKSHNSNLWVELAVDNISGGEFDWSVEYLHCDQFFWIFRSSSKNFETIGISGFNTGNICF